MTSRQLGWLGRYRSTKMPKPEVPPVYKNDNIWDFVNQHWVFSQKEKPIECLTAMVYELCKRNNSNYESMFQDVLTLFLDYTKPIPDSVTTTAIKEDSETWGTTYRCNSCKHQIEKYHTFCPNCGKKIDRSK